MKELDFIATEELKDELERRNHNGNTFVLGTWGNNAIRITKHSYCYSVKMLFRVFGFRFHFDTDISVDDAIRLSTWLNHAIEDQIT